MPFQKITPERVALLDGLGFNWGKGFPAPVSWDERFKEYKTYKQTYGEVTIHQANPTPLASWVMAQRTEFKRGKKGLDTILSMDKIQQLNEAGFKWK